MSRYDIWLDMDIFPNAAFPTGRDEIEVWNAAIREYNGISSEMNALGIIFHKPGQLTRSIRAQSVTWDFKTANSSLFRYHTLKFDVKGMQVLKRRNKRNAPCTGGIPEDDEELYNIAMKKAGCRPSFIKSSTELSICSNTEQIRMYNSIVGQRMVQGDPDDDLTLQPCVSLESLEYSFSYVGSSIDEIKELYEMEPDLSEPLLNATSALKLEFNFRIKRFQLISRLEKYSPEALIGNAGKQHYPYDLKSV